MMYNYEHKKLVEAIGKLNQVPTVPEEFSEWIKAGEHLALLRQNALADELALYVSSRYFFAHSVVVPNDKLTPVDQGDLMKWSFNHFRTIASYVSGGEREGVWVERGLDHTGTKTLEGATQLIFGRTFEGMSGSGSLYYELHQEYAHLAEIHWRPEKKAYCRFNEHGDLDPVVSITIREEESSGISLASFKWEPLEEYLAASKASLVRMFDFPLFRSSDFSGWPNDPPQKNYESKDLFYRQRIMLGRAAYTRGVQIIRPRRSEKTIFARITDGWPGQEDKEYVEFTAYDWRNGRVTKISTDPSATANYFNAEGNSLPYELSPAFFRPEVLSKYKTDRDKYTVGARDVSCRAAWYLKGIDVNEAGQVHAYICDLRDLPYTEQLHWLSFNEPPKANISEQAFINDFKGEFTDFEEPLQKVLSTARHWHDRKVEWWTLRDEKLLDRVNTPLTASRDEWAEAFMDLAKLVVEGFEMKRIRARLDKEQIAYGKDDKTITLLEKLLNEDNTSGDTQRLVGLRNVQNVRSKAKGHAGGSEGEELAQNALLEHETYGNHFRFICTQVSDELETIERLFSIAPANKVG